MRRVVVVVRSAVAMDRPSGGDGGTRRADGAGGADDAADVALVVVVMASPLHHLVLYGLYELLYELCEPATPE